MQVKIRVIRIQHNNTDGKGGLILELKDYTGEEMGLDLHGLENGDFFHITAEKMDKADFDKVPEFDGW